MVLAKGHIKLDVRKNLLTVDDDAVQKWWLQKLDDPLSDVFLWGLSLSESWTRWALKFLLVIKFPVSGKRLEAER